MVNLIFCFHLKLLPAKNSLKWIRIKCLTWCRRNKEIIVTLGNNTSIISVTLGSWCSVLVQLVGHQVNEGNGINTQGMERPQEQEQETLHH